MLKRTPALIVGIVMILPLVAVIAVGCDVGTSTTATPTPVPPTPTTWATPIITSFTTLPDGRLQGITYLQHAQTTPILRVEVYGQDPAAVQTYIADLQVRFVVTQSATLTTTLATALPVTTSTLTSTLTPPVPPTTQITPAALPTVAGPLTIWHPMIRTVEEPNDDYFAFVDALSAARQDNPAAEIHDEWVSLLNMDTRFDTEAQAGGGPDLLLASYHYFDNAARAGLLLPLDDRLRGRLNDKLPAAVENARVDGVLYGIPVSLGAATLLYDKTRLPDPPKTMDELLAVVRPGVKLRGRVPDSVKLRIAQKSSYSWAFYNAFGGQALDQSGRCVADQGGVAEALAYLKALKDAGAEFVPPPLALVQGGSRNFDALVINPASDGAFRAAQAMLNENLDRFGAVPLPAGPKGSAMPLTNGLAWYINAKTKNPEAAVNFALYMTSPKIAQLLAGKANMTFVPADKTVPLANPIMAGFVQAAEGGSAAPPGISSYWTPFDDALDKVLNKGIGPQQAVAEACAAIPTPTTVPRISGSAASGSTVSDSPQVSHPVDRLGLQKPGAMIPNAENTAPGQSLSDTPITLSSTRNGFSNERGVFQLLLASPVTGRFFGTGDFFTQPATSTEDLVILFEVDNVTPPYFLSAELDPYLGQWVNHYYRPGSATINATITRKNGKLFGALYGEGRPRPLDSRTLQSATPWSFSRSTSTPCLRMQGQLVGTAPGPGGVNRPINQYTITVNNIYYAQFTQPPARRACP